MNKVEITVDVITGDSVTNETPFTAQELAYSAQVTAQAQANAQTSIDVKESAFAKLSALGLTENEITAILGTSILYNQAKNTL
jgi:hypothetical protein